MSSHVSININLVCRWDRSRELIKSPIRDQCLHRLVFKSGWKKFSPCVKYCAPFQKFRNGKSQPVNLHCKRTGIHISIIIQKVYHHPVQLMPHHDVIPQTPFCSFTRCHSISPCHPHTSTQPHSIPPCYLISYLHTTSFHILSTPHHSIYLRHISSYLHTSSCMLL